MEGEMVVQCSAKSQQSQQQCKRVATPGRDVGYMHVGKSLSGIASPTYIHGRASKYLPLRMQQDFTAALRAQSLALTKDVAVLEARLLDLYKRVDTGESGRLWTE